MRKLKLKDKLKKARLRSGLTQKQLAKEVNLTPAWISHFETGRRQPNAENLLKIAKLLDCSIEYLTE